LIPPDSEVPPRKPSDIGGTSNGHHTHAEHAMSPSIDVGKQLALSSVDDPAYEDYMEEVENMRHRNKDSDAYDFNK
ncbi:unnamed protein product, partial [Rotaria sp. Silwood1]